MLGEKYVASNAYSIEQSVYEKGWIVKGIEANGTIVGFTMYGWCEEEKYYELCRFMIDRKYQGKGYGKEALSLIVHEMKNEFKCKEIYLCVDSENIRAKKIYEQFGFIFTGRIVDEEDLYKIKL